MGDEVKENVSLMIDQFFCNFRFLSFVVHEKGIDQIRK